MTIAEQKALKAYPKDEREFKEWNGKTVLVDYNKEPRSIFIKGYQEGITDAIDRLNEALDIDGSYLRELLTEPEKL